MPLMPLMPAPSSFADALEEQLQRLQSHVIGLHARELQALQNERQQLEPTVNMESETTVIPDWDYCLNETYDEEGQDLAPEAINPSVKAPPMKPCVLASRVVSLGEYPIVALRKNIPRRGSPRRDSPRKDASPIASPRKASKASFAEGVVEDEDIFQQELPNARLKSRQTSPFSEASQAVLQVPASPMPPNCSRWYRQMSPNSVSSQTTPRQSIASSLRLSTRTQATVQSARLSTRTHASVETVRLSDPTVGTACSDDTLRLSNPTVGTASSVETLRLSNPTAGTVTIITDVGETASMPSETGSQNGDPDNCNSYYPSQTQSRTLTRMLQQAEDPASERLIFYAAVHPKSTMVWTQFRAWVNISTRDTIIVSILDVVMGFIILVNCIFIGVSFDTDEWGGWRAVEGVFAGIYFCEIAIKLKVLGFWEMYYYGKGRTWALFDTTVLLLSLIALFGHFGGDGSVAVIRILRLGRVARLVKWIRVPAMKELVMLLTGMLNGARCLFWCMFGLALPIFVLGMIFSRFLRKWDVGLFSTVPEAMFTTFRCMTGDCTDAQGRPVIVHMASHYGWHVALFYALFMMVSIFGVFNLITAIFIEGTMRSAKHDTDLQRQIRETDNIKFARNIKKLVFMFWQTHQARESNVTSSTVQSEVCRTRTDPNLLDSRILEKFSIADAMGLVITQEFYDKMVAESYVREVLDDMGCHDDDIVDLFNILDVDHSGTLDLNELVEGIYKLRGDATKRDLVALAYMIFSLQENVVRISSSLELLTGVKTPTNKRHSGDERMSGNVNVGHDSPTLRHSGDEIVSRNSDTGH